MRTGDLGCISQGELLTTGRLQDWLVFQGRNYAPQDLEMSYQDLSENIRKGCGVIIQPPGANEEKIIVVQEVKANRELDALADAIRHRILQEFSVPVSE